MSVFAPHIKKMMDMYHNLGFDLYYLECNLNEFDSYCNCRSYSELTVTKEFAEEWIYSSNTSSKQQLDKRVRTMKYLGRYLNSIGIEAYIPTYSLKADPSKPPTLLDNEDLAVLFKAFDLLQPGQRKKNPNRHYLYPVIFRLIYACGLRSSEACNLKVEDVDLQEGKLTIWHSKGNKDREVYMDQSMLDLCIRFNEVYTHVLPARRYFFQPSYEMPKFTSMNLCDAFNLGLKKANLQDKYPNQPTVHGLRHLFACKSMAKCLEQGYDFNNWIKYLSQYMGHKTPNETLYYLHTITDLIPQYAEKMKALETGSGVVYEED